jgi:WD40 repeat protein
VLTKDHIMATPGITSPARNTILSGAKPSAVPTSVHVVTSTNNGGTRVLVAHDNGKISILSPTTLEEVVIEANTSGAIWALASWNDDRFAGAGTEGLLKVWDLKTLSVLAFKNIQSHLLTNIHANRDCYQEVS